LLIGLVVVWRDAGVVYGFNVSVAQRVSAVAKSQKVRVLMHKVIYRLIADIKAELSDRLLPRDVEQFIGEFCH